MKTQQEIDAERKQELLATAELIGASAALLAENEALREEVAVLKKRLEFPEPEWVNEGNGYWYFTHPLQDDITFVFMKHNKETPFHIAWGCGVSKYATVDEAKQAVRDYLNKEWERIHA